MASSSSQSFRWRFLLVTALWRAAAAQAVTRTSCVRRYHHKLHPLCHPHHHHKKAASSWLFKGHAPSTGRITLTTPRRQICAPIHPSSLLRRHHRPIAPSQPPTLLAQVPSEALAPSTALRRRRSADSYFPSSPLARRSFRSSLRPPRPHRHHSTALPYPVHRPFSPSPSVAP
ncbi:uncharacterized protein A4U43_C04F20430 [Asparagus officinalis]|uniref:Uncharacterized protein n=1 Tax=Asparagus officinalis TaxID=4686 RepID=A0A5P1F2E6_ASPOF|nr:uncharacterized protein A4U43_C04F20430 [Asparagus officinalis]